MQLCLHISGLLRLQLKVAVVSRQAWAASKAVPALQHRGGAPGPAWVWEEDRPLGIQQHLELWRLLTGTNPARCVSSLELAGPATCLFYIFILR